MSVHAIVLADGAAPTRAELDAAWPAWDAEVQLVVAADGGARHAGPLGLTIDRWVGDGDSTSPVDLDALVAAGVVVDRVPVEKDASDTELAVLAAAGAGATEVSILGGLGGARLDHELTNVALLAHPALGARTARLYDQHAARVTLLQAMDAGPATARLVGRVGDIVTLVPTGGAAAGVTTTGLRYPLADETLSPGSSRGLSNLRTTTEAGVSIRSGRLLLIETPATFRP